jgi:hypothetical protein
MDLSTTAAAHLGPPGDFPEGRFGRQLLKYRGLASWHERGVFAALLLMAVLPETGRGAR